MRTSASTRRKFLKTSALSAAALALDPQNLLARQPPESFKGHSDFGPMPAPAPDWLRHAVIAEIPTRGFNVSHKDIKRWKSHYGDTTYRAIAAKLDFMQATGFNVLCLYSIYDCSPRTNLYAYRYNATNPDMGTLSDAKFLIQQAHDRGMYVISNTNHYGTAPDSPLLTEHPDWFLPPTQMESGQRMFDINVPAARAYIIDTHTFWCTEAGLDGWRIDLGSNMFKKSIWSEVVVRCEAKGKRILLAPENRPLVGHIQGSGKHGYPPILDMQNSGFVTAKSTAEDPYRVREISGHNAGEHADKTPCCAYNSPAPGSCDREGCFKVRGSQFIFGHNSLFAPMVPWMLVGETFNATHLALPVMDYTPKMLHAWLDWTDVDRHQDTVNDFRKLAKIRAAHPDIFHNNIYETRLLNVDCTSTPASPVIPYVRYLSGKKAAVVVGNDNVAADITFNLKLPLTEMGMEAATAFHVTECWSNTTTKVAATALAAYAVFVPRDKSPGGGVHVLAITPA